MRVYCSKIVNLITYTRFDGASVCVINVKKKHILIYTILNKNALMIFIKMLL